MKEDTHRTRPPQKRPPTAAQNRQTPKPAIPATPKHTRGTANEAKQQAEHQPPQPPRPALDDRAGWRTYWQAQGQSWRTEPLIDTQRQQFLAQRRAIQPNIQQSIYPFKDIQLSRADLEWLLATHESGGIRGPVDVHNQHQQGRIGLDLRGANLSYQDLRNLPLASLVGGLGVVSPGTAEQRRQAGVHFEGANLLGVHLERSLLSCAHFDRAELLGVHLEAANLLYAYLEMAELPGAHLEAAYLCGANFERANLQYASLEGAILVDAQLAGTNLSGAHLEGAVLRRAHLEGANLVGASLGGKRLATVDLERVGVKTEHFRDTLPPADLRQAFLDGGTLLGQIHLGDEEYGFAWLANVGWGQANLSVVQWAQVPLLGDEQEAYKQIGHNGMVKELAGRIRDYEAAIRANRQLSAALRSQGMNEVADRFALRAQVLQRELLWLEVGLPISGIKHSLARLKDQPLPYLWRKRKALRFRRVWSHPGQWLHQQGQRWWQGLRSLQPTTWQVWLRKRPLWEWSFFLLVLGLALGSSLAHWWRSLLAVLGLSLVLLVLRQPRGRKLLAYLFSLLLSVLAGYGYRPGRALAWYLAVTSGFALVYATLGHLPFFPDALVLSLTSFHGRGFFPGLGTTPSLHDPLVVGAALEAVIGLFIEISFIATFTQRFFGR